jgi:RNA polymerase sigma factor (sigma-70 family)
MSRSLREEIAEHITSLRRYALVLTRNREEAEDLVQECLARAIAAADSFRPGADMRAWLFRILHNVHVSALRRQKVRETLLPGQEDGERSVEAGQYRALEVREVLDALGQLPDEQRRAVTLIALEEMKYDEAAKVLGVPVGTLMSRLGRGRAALRELLGGQRQARQPGPKLRIVKGG